MRLHTHLKPSIARASLCLLAVLLLTSGLLPHSTARHYDQRTAEQESTTFDASRIGKPAQPRSIRSDPAPEVTSITPSSGVNTGVIDITDLSGSSFQSGATVKLTKTGQTDIPGSGVSVVSSSTITCTLDLTGVLTGTWDVVVTNPDDQSGVLAEGFTVRAPSYVYLPRVIRYWPRFVSLKLYPAADATVAQAYPEVNTGDAYDMWVGYDHCPNTLARITRSLIRFDTPVVPAGAPIVQATLYLYLMSSCDLGQRPHRVTAYRTTGSWQELSVTWNNKPGYAEAYGSTWIPSLTWGWYSLDVSDLVEGWVKGSFANHGLTLRGPESSGDDSARLGFFTLQESGITHDPYLEVWYADYSAVASEPKVPADAPSHATTPPGPAIEELLSPPKDSAAEGASEFVERTEGTSD